MVSARRDPPPCVGLPPLANLPQRSPRVEDKRGSSKDEVNPPRRSRIRSVDAVEASKAALSLKVRETSWAAQAIDCLASPRLHEVLTQRPQTPGPMVWQPKPSEDPVWSMRLPAPREPCNRPAPSPRSDPSGAAIGRLLLAGTSHKGSNMPTPMAPEASAEAPAPAPAPSATVSARQSKRLAGLCHLLLLGNTFDGEPRDDSEPDPTADGQRRWKRKLKKHWYSYEIMAQRAELEAKEAAAAEAQLVIDEAAARAMAALRVQSRLRGLRARRELIERRLLHEIRQQELEVETALAMEGMRSFDKPLARELQDTEAHDPNAVRQAMWEHYYMSLDTWRPVVADGSAGVPEAPLPWTTRRGQAATWTKAARKQRRSQERRDSRERRDASLSRLPPPTQLIRRGDTSRKGKVDETARREKKLTFARAPKVHVSEAALARARAIERMDLIVKHDAHNKEQAAAGKPLAALQLERASYYDDSDSESSDEDDSVGSPNLDESSFRSSRSHASTPRSPRRNHKMSPSRRMLNAMDAEHPDDMAERLKAEAEEAVSVLSRATDDAQEEKKVAGMARLTARQALMLAHVTADDTKRRSDLQRSILGAGWKQRCATADQEDADAEQAIKDAEAAVARATLAEEEVGLRAKEKIDRARMEARDKFECYAATQDESQAGALWLKIGGGAVKCRM